MNINSYSSMSMIKQSDNDLVIAEICTPSNQPQSENDL